MTFSWSDAWVFISANYGIDNSGKLDFVSFIAAGDSLNHAIMSDNEIRGGFYKLCIRGLIKIDHGIVSLTEISKPIIDKVTKMRGGHFSVVDNCLKVLNSSGTILPESSDEPNLDFLTENLISDSYKEYQKRANAV